MQCDLVLVINVVWMFSIYGCFYLLCNQQHACLHTSQTTVFVIFQMKKKTKAAILASVASVLLVGVALLRKLWRRRRRLPRALYVNHAAKREEYINSILHGSEKHCVNKIRMKPIISNTYVTSSLRGSTYAQLFTCLLRSKCSFSYTLLVIM